MLSAPAPGPGPKTKWRPASLPASTVPRSVSSCPKAWLAFPGRFRPRPCGPGRSLRFLRRTIAGPVPVPAGPAPNLAAGFGSLAGSFRLGLAASTSGSLSDSDEAKLLRYPFAVPSARGLRVPPDPRRKVGSALACAAASRFFLPVARTSLLSASVRRLRPLSAGPSLRASLRFRRPRPATRAHWHRCASRGKW